MVEVHADKSWVGCKPLAMKKHQLGVNGFVEAPNPNAYLCYFCFETLRGWAIDV